VNDVASKHKVYKTGSRCSAGFEELLVVEDTKEVGRIHQKLIIHRKFKLNCMRGNANSGEVLNSFQTCSDIIF
jgi:hypothetical protein